MNAKLNNLINVENEKMMKRVKEEIERKKLSEERTRKTAVEFVKCIEAEIEKKANGESSMIDVMIDYDDFVKLVFEFEMNTTMSTHMHYFFSTLSSQEVRTVLINVLKENGFESARFENIDLNGRFTLVVSK